MKKFLFLFSLLSCISLHSQEAEYKQEVELVVDNLIHITFEKNLITPTNDGVKILERLGMIFKEDPEILKNYIVLFQVVPSIEEKEGNKLLEYERIDYMLEFLQKEYHVDTTNFRFSFLDAIPIESVFIVVFQEL